MRRKRTSYGLARFGRRASVIPRALILGSAVLLPLVMICQVLYAAEGVAVMRVEEDWEVVLNEPDQDVTAPQFHTVISPSADVDSLYHQVCWNYREQWEFAPGGLQLLVWGGEFLVGKKSFRDDALSTAAETITWTQSMRTNGSMLTFEIKDGHSTTWGAFGGAETSLSGDVGMANVNGYSTDVSVANSWVSYGANRVNLLSIKEVRRYDAEGRLISRDQTPRIVYQLKQ